MSNSLSGTAATIDAHPAAPVQYLSEQERLRLPEPGKALCLSGGGYRAMLFHAGTLLRLNELAYLRRLRRISSVSGGSITAGILGARWRRLTFVNDVATNFDAEVIDSVRRLAQRTIDIPAALLGLVWPSAAGRCITAAYRKYLFGDATLQDLPDDSEGPRFVINASNVQSTVLWRFMKPYMRDYRVGELEKPDLPLSTAVAASSAFPPFLSPVRLRLRHEDFTPGTGDDLQRPPFTTRVVLTDGGVYDNLGLETAWKRYDTILVSDAGGLTGAEERPRQGWLRHTLRVLWLTDRQVRALRKSQLIDSYKYYQRSRGAPGEESRLVKAIARQGAYWGIRTGIADYGLPDALPCPVEQTQALADVPTRLARVPKTLQDRLMNWGYAACAFCSADKVLRVPNHVNDSRSAAIVVRSRSAEEGVRRAVEFREAGSSRVGSSSSEVMDRSPVREQRWTIGSCRRLSAEEQGAGPDGLRTR